MNTRNLEGKLWKLNLTNGNFEQNVETCKKIVEIEPNNIIAWLNLGYAYYRIDDHKKTIESYKKIVEIEPENMEIRFRLGLAYALLGNHEKSNEWYDKGYLKDRFRFLRDDIFLCPRVNLITEKQSLILQKINLITNEVEFEDSIDCIQTVVTVISPENYEDYQNDTNTQEFMNKKILEIRSSEGLTEINLTPEEKFKAFKSWTAGIAEAGMNAFLIQDEIDKNLDLFYPISHFLLRFMAKADNDFLQEYLTKIERDCMFEGKKHKPSFLANILPILEMVWANYLKNRMIGSKDIEIVKTIAAMDNSIMLFKNNTNFLILLMLIEPEYAKSIMTPEEKVKTQNKLIEHKKSFKIHYYRMGDSQKERIS